MVGHQVLENPPFRQNIPAPGPGLLRLKPAALELGQRSGITATVRYRRSRQIWLVAKTRGSAVEELLLGSAPHSGPPEISRASGQSILAAIKSLRPAGGVPLYADADGLGELLTSAGLETSPFFAPGAALARFETAVEEHVESLQKTLTLATDASAGGRSQWVGHGWVMDFGHDTPPLLGLRAQHQGAILEGELRSIRLGLTDARNRAPGISTGQCVVTVVADNQTAVNLLASPGFTSRSVTAGCAKELALISSLTAGADVSFDWVRGHAGHTLNNAADRLAVLARRAKEAELSMSERDYLIAGIRETAFLKPVQDLLALAA